MNSPTTPCSCRGCTNGGQACDITPESLTADLPPVAMGYLDDTSKWVWLSPRPVGVCDWILTTCIVVLAVPVLLTFGPVVLVLRAFGSKER